MDKNKDKVKINNELLNTRVKSEKKSGMVPLDDAMLDSVSGGAGYRAICHECGATIYGYPCDICGWGK
jgi:hypothetical protein